MYHWTDWKITKSEKAQLQVCLSVSIVRKRTEPREGHASKFSGGFLLSITSSYLTGMKTERNAVEANLETLHALNTGLLVLRTVLTYILFGTKQLTEGQKGWGSDKSGEDPRFKLGIGGIILREEPG